MSRPAIFLDRDGVICESRAAPGQPVPPIDHTDVVIPAGVPEALRALRAAGYLLIVVTNQPDVARGTVTLDEVDAINQVLVGALPIDAVYMCVHDGSGCACRKPRPGLLVDAAREHSIDLGSSWMIGDRWVDIAAGRAAGTRTVLLERPYSWLPTSQGPPPGDLHPDVVVQDMADLGDALRPGEPRTSNDQLPSSG